MWRCISPQGGLQKQKKIIWVGRATFFNKQLHRNMPTSLSVERVGSTLAILQSHHHLPFSSHSKRIQACQPSSKQAATGRHRLPNLQPLESIKST